MSKITQDNLKVPHTKQYLLQCYKDAVQNTHTHKKDVLKGCSAKHSPVNDAGAVSTRITISRVLSCSVGEPVRREKQMHRFELPITTPVGIFFPALFSSSFTYGLITAKIRRL